MRDRWSLGTGLFFLLLAAVTLAVWIPRDIETGIVEVFRRSRTIGDALAPVIAASGVAVMSLVLIAGSLSRTESLPATSGRLTAENLRFVGILVAVLVVSLAVMFWTGPLLVKLANSFGLTPGSYRELRGTAPWKYTGYLCGGTLLIFCLVSFIEARLRWLTLAIAVAITLTLALLYDLPFDSLLLPPNGDY
jgi:hypothetical protein